MAVYGVWMEFEYLHLCEKDALWGGLELGVGRGGGDRPEARGKSQSSEFKPGLPGCFEDIYYGRRMEYVFI